MEPLWTVAVPALTSLLVVAGGYYANSKLGIAAGQRTLVDTLKDTVAAQRDEIDRMKVEFAGCKERMEHLEDTVEDLKLQEFKLRTDLQNAQIERRRRPR